MIDITTLLFLVVQVSLLTIATFFHKSLLLLLVSGAIMIFTYGSYRCKNPDFKDPLETPIGIGELDGWSLTHFLLFIIVGYMFPDKYVMALAIGCGWELFENYYGENRPGWLGGYGDCDKLASGKTEDGNWWYGKWTDIVMNTLGIIVGVYLNRKDAVGWIKTLK